MKLSLIVLAALGLSRLLRHRSAALRHWVLAAAVACAAAVPLLEAVMPAWRLPIAPPAAFEPYGATSEAGVGVAAASRAGLAGEPRNVDAPRSAASTVEIRPFDLSATLQTIWLIGAIVSLCVLIVGILRLSWLTARARRVTGGQWSNLAGEISRAYGLRRLVVLLQSDHPTLLVTWGLTSPKIILPAEAIYWTEARARVVLAHELAHIRRGDWMVQIWAELLRAAYWFNPLLWIACKKLRLESEHACDDEVMSHGIEASDYASHLVELARALNHRRHAWLPAPAMARPSSLERRVRAMLNDRLNRTSITVPTRIGIFAALFVVTLAVAAAQTGFVSFSGSVADEQGRGIPGTTLILANEQRQMKYEVKTNDAGRFEFVGLPAGEYGLEVRGLGFQVLKDVLKISGQNLQRNFALKLGSLMETVTVRFDPTEADSRPPVTKEVAMPAPRDCVASSAGGRIVPPRKIRDVAPQYPASLRATATEGTVVVEGTIGIDGYVGDIRVIGEAHPDLVQAAIAAVREWRFTQTLLNCEPVEVKMTITTHFNRVAPPVPAAPRP